MLQRIQSIYLLTTSLLFIVWLFLPLWDLGIDIVPDSTGPALLKNELLTLICVIGGASFSLVIIFLYKNRDKQRRFVRLLSIWAFAILLYAITSPELLGINYFEYFASHIGIGSFVPAVIFLLNFMASKSIKKDEELIRSMDRLR